ncbi:MAG TPA: STAS domain-containing protein [Chitinophagaceae bacterium]|nr:STAS domain-containing protein [Chitinophagaceae bacterium]
MKVKIDTKEKFNVIVMEEAHLSANMTEAIKELVISFKDKEIKNVIFKMGNVMTLDYGIASTLAEIQQSFYDGNCSFVICEIQKEVENFLDREGLLEMLNITPTESEAWDIVQMEEIEREYLD